MRKMKMNITMRRMMAPHLAQELISTLRPQQLSRQSRFQRGYNFSDLLLKDSSKTQDSMKLFQGQVPTRWVPNRLPT
jgi:hypothetical protein